jgi:GT2 family glycosyltransferase
MSEPRVQISIPTKENIHAETVGWVLNAVKNAPKMGYTVGVRIIYSPYPVELQRNNQVFEFLKEENKDYTHMFLLDSDCVPEEGTLEKLLDYDLDIVNSVAPSLIKGGVVFTSGWRIPGAVGADKFRMLEVSNDKAHGLQEVDGVGATGVLIKRRVFETIPYPWFQVLYDQDRIDLGEDYFFSQKAQEYGFKIYADFDLRQRHHKMVAL